MATTKENEKLSEEYFDVKCYICAKRGKEQEAGNYCYECNKHFCNSCLYTHNEFIENHKVVQCEKGDIDVLTEKCFKHTDELLTMYCDSCKEILCRKCYIRDHRNCQDVKDIIKNLDELSADPGLPTSFIQLEYAIDDISQLVEIIDERLVSIEEKGNVYLKEIEDFAKKLSSRIGELREKAEMEVRNKQKQIISDVKEFRQVCLLSLNEFREHLADSKRCDKRKAHMFILKKECQVWEMKVGKSIKDLFSQTREKFEEFDFEINESIFSSLEDFTSMVS